MKTYITPEQAISVLPDGDSVHTFYNPGFGLVGADWSKDAKYQSDIPEIGKTVFLTREEAEDALEGMKNG